MALVARTFEGANVTAKADGGFYQSLFSDGVLWGCELTTNTTSITMQAGQLLAGGRMIGNDNTLTYTLSPQVATGYGRVILNIKLDETTPMYLTADYRADQNFPALTQETINNSGNIYQVAIAIVGISASQITGIVSQIGAVTLSDRVFGTVAGKMLPVGTIIETTVNVNPSTYLGGTWVAWGAGEVAVGVDPSNADYNAANKTGGHASITLSASNMPSHSHTASVIINTTNMSHQHEIPQLAYQAGYGLAQSESWGSNLFLTGDNRSYATRWASTNHNHSGSVSIGNTGGGAAFDNRMRYRTCYRFVRTA